MDKILIEKLANRIKELRKINNFTQDELAFRAGIGRSTLGNIETAQNDITFSKLNKIAKAFNLSLAEFLNFWRMIEFYPFLNSNPSSTYSTIILSPSLNSFPKSNLDNGFSISCLIVLFNGLAP